MFRFLRFRTHANPSLPLPLNVRSAGHYILEGKSGENREAGSFVQLFWCAGGSGKIRWKGKDLSFRPGTVFFYHPGESHHLKAGRSSLEYRWLTLDGAMAENIPSRFGLGRIQSAGPCPAHLFDQLDPCLQDATAEGERRASLVAYRIFLLAASPDSEKKFPEQQIHSVQSAKAWMEAHFMDARLNVSQLSSRFRLHRSTLYRIFMKHYGVAPVQYLNRLRLRQALELLNGSSLPVADVAVRAGIPDIAYFSRLIRKNTGFSPRAYRRHALTQSPSSPASGKRSGKRPR